MLHIDGRYGEGGGQILRTSLALAALTGQPFTMHHIRGQRPKPGLMRQHLTSVQAAAQVANARVTGAELRSQELCFEPGSIAGGNFHFAIGSGGSTVLVAQTILPMLLASNTTSSVCIEGGTHNPMAPTTDFVMAVLLPHLQAMGHNCTCEVEKIGFMSAGGGRIHVHVAPSQTTKPWSLSTFDQHGSLYADIKSAGLNVSIAEREAAVIQRKLRLPQHVIHCNPDLSSVGPGNALSIFYQTDHYTECFSSCGAVRKSAERVAGEAVAQCQAYLKTAAPVGEHLADQLMLPLLVAAGGSYRTGGVSTHAQTNATIINRFVPGAVTIEQHTAEHNHIVVRALTTS